MVEKQAVNNTLTTEHASLHWTVIGLALIGILSRARYEGYFMATSIKILASTGSCVPPWCALRLQLN